MGKAISCHLAAQQVTIFVSKEPTKLFAHNSVLASKLMTYSIDAKVLK